MSEAVERLRSPRTIRQRAAQLLAAGLHGELEHFALDMPRLSEVARFTAQITRKRYPDLHVPPHSRFGHFDAGNVPRMAALEAALSEHEPRERARRLSELVITSVLLDAGAGMQWQYAEPDSARSFGRSEGLAVASLAWAKQGGLSSHQRAYHVDAAGLAAVSAQAFEQAFQVREDNPLLGVDGRVALLHGLARTLQARPELFGAPARLGGLVDRLCERAQAGKVSAASVLSLVLDALSSIFPGRIVLDGAPLGDVWRHAALSGGVDDETRGLLPLHKLSQWLCYSLLHPLAVAGLEVTQLDELTGLAEYRNGGLFVDLGVLVPKHARVLSETHAVDSELVVEWRGLTVALLDKLAPLVRSELGLSTAQLPLAAVLEGGTWAAGRAAAETRRADAGPPIRVVSDGTVF